VYSVARLTSIDRLLEIVNSSLLGGEAATLLMVEPAKLLENLCVLRVPIKDAQIRSLRVIKLEGY